MANVATIQQMKRKRAELLGEFRTWHNEIAGEDGAGETDEYCD
ncbi:MAG: hypothetical protein ACYSYL_20290 [Planctomycetota bacterium]|jgi:hypothetical protein